jgi:Ca-activated chloride channel family protein
MTNRAKQALLLIVLSCTAAAQVMSIPSSGFGDMGPGSLGAPVFLGLISSEQMTNNLFSMTTNAQNHGVIESPSASVSKLDFKAPWRARREYEKGYQLLMRKDYLAAVEHLKQSTTLYPSFVAAHNSLGSAYLDLGRNDQARDEFSQAVSLDDHLPNSYLNLGCAELAVKHYAAAEEAIKKASSIAPLDLQLLTALAYGQLMNKNYDGVVSTARQVHGRKHKGAATIHFFAAGALEAQGNLAEAQSELEVLLGEDPKSTTADQVRQILQEIKDDQTKRSKSAGQPAPASATFSFDTPAAPTTEQASQQARKILQDLKEKRQISEAEAEPEPNCTSCGPTTASAPVEAKLERGPMTSMRNSDMGSTTTVLHSSVDEVAVFFAATDHGKSVTDLTGADIGIRDDRRDPEAILGFRNEADLPLRLGLIIDTSNSVTTRFSFEQSAANHFLQNVLTNKDDLAFVVGVANSVLLVQDFTADQKLVSRAVDQLAPSGGTALWDAVAFAAEKLGSRPESQPVARILVVISDGEDNSSTTTLKQAIEQAQRGEVAVYTVSTRDYGQEDAGALLGDHALRTLAELTGGTIFMPGSVHRLKGSLAELHQVIRGRYLISYKPAAFRRDGQYRTIEIAAQKDGHKLRVYARKGYYAAAPTPAAKDDF